MERNILSVTQINEYIRDKLDVDPILASVAVRGEISNYKVYPSGHHYFTVKDQNASLRCVMFKGNAYRLRFRPENGMQVIVMGRISVYPRDGGYQLYCTDIVPDGVGDLYAAFEQLKQKLAAMGMFDAAHKKPLPQYPNVIGIVTSSAGAAVHDMLRILGKRFPVCRVRIFPVRVQGVEAPSEIAAAIDYANRHRLADLLIVGRGGGSMEDLWAFNDPQVARAIYDSQIPVISAVGHEPDVTISDFVADVRAATPSNGAELAVVDRQHLYQVLDGFGQSMAVSLQRRIEGESQRLNMLAASPALKSPGAQLALKRQSLDVLQNKLSALLRLSVEDKAKRYVALTSKLDAMSPLKVLTRGYAIMEGQQGIVRSLQDVSIGDKLQVTVSDGKFIATVTERSEVTK